MFAAVEWWVVDGYFKWEGRVSYFKRKSDEGGTGGR